MLGAYHLHALTRDAALDFCVYYSSATTLFGNPGQSNYVAANMWLEALAMHRRASGLPATCVRWGAIDDVGFLARNEAIRDALQSRMGARPFLQARRWPRWRSCCRLAATAWPFWSWTGTP
ncbi:polyketide synthase [Bordetella holmesii]|nr:polyketide synthase [Bordetella holmesii]